MKKKIALALVLCIIAIMLCGCSSSYEEANTFNVKNFGAGYFTTIKEWKGGVDYPYERIVYANDTGVMYYIFLHGHTGGITPLYNADGTLQIYEGEQLCGGILNLSPSPTNPILLKNLLYSQFVLTMNVAG